MGVDHRETRKCFAASGRNLYHTWYQVPGRRVCPLSRIKRFKAVFMIIGYTRRFAPRAAFAARYACSGKSAILCGAAA